MLAGLRVGGAIRFNYVQNDYSNAYDGSGKLDFDTARLELHYEQDGVIGAAEYRYYRSRAAGDSRFVQKWDGANDSHFATYAWLGYRSGQVSGDHEEVQFGLNLVPFGALPFVSNSYFFQLPYYLGFEGAYNVGAKYAIRHGNWQAHFGFYFKPAPNGHGESRDSARYTYNVVSADGARNTERNTVVARLARSFALGTAGSTEVGVSLLAGQLPNRSTNRRGARHAIALHAVGDYGRWNVKLQWLRYRYELKNPAGSPDDVVMLGAYDAPYEAAAKGAIYLTGLSYALPVHRGPLEDVNFYWDFALLRKESDRFRDTRQHIVGAAWKMGRWLLHTDLVFAQGHPFIGPDYGTALSTGSAEWHRRFNINIGYYF